MHELECSFDVVRKVTLFLYLYLTDLLNVQCFIHKSTSKLTVTVSWTCGSHSTTVDSWELRVRNLTWEQNDYCYDQRTFICDGGDSLLCY